MGRFMEMVEEFNQLPPQHEIARTGILMPGDKGYPKSKITPKQAEQELKRTIQPARREPEWMRQRRLKEERKRAGVKHGG